MRCTINLDELRILPKCDVFAYGEADVEYSLAPAEPDIGIMRPYVEDWYVTAIDVGRRLDPQESLYKLIEAALARDLPEYIERCCMDDSQ
jgi:hypothetical protein